MVARCNKVGVDIIVDAVFNQMAAGANSHVAFNLLVSSFRSGSGTGIAGSSYGNRAYNTLYTQDDFHHYSYDSSKNCVVSSRREFRRLEAYRGANTDKRLHEQG
jgi:hypothetical protein